MEDCERKYKEAFNMAVLEHKSENEAVRESIERIFPQLKESEDECIRKEILDYIHAATGCKRWVAWLEKEGKHANFRNKIQIGDKVTRNQDGVLVNLSQLKRVAVKENKGNYGGISPNSEWSEEDERERKRVVGLLEGWLSTFKETCYAEDCKCGIEWLRTLKDRVGCEVNCTTKQEWSEEDDEIIHSIEQCIYDNVANIGTINRYVDWLESLRPQNTWKPSEEQMKALNEALYHVDDSIATQIAKLIGELKKL